MEIGDVFKLTDRKVNEHVFVVISHPQSNYHEVVLVNFTSYDESRKDSSCVLGPGDHSWIRKTTCISYRDARVASESQLDSLVTTGQLVPLDPASDSLLGKILSGAERTDELPGKCRRVLEQQGLISA